MYGNCTYVFVSAAENRDKQSELCSLQAVNLKKLRLFPICHPSGQVMIHALVIVLGDLGQP